MFDGRDLDYTDKTSESKYLVTKVFMNNNYREIIYYVYEEDEELVATISFFQNPDGVFSHGEFWKDVDLDNKIIKRLVSDKNAYKLLKEKGFIRIDSEETQKEYYLDVDKNLKRLSLSSSIINDIDNIIEDNQYINAKKRLIDICEILNRKGIEHDSVEIKSILDEEINNTKFEEYNENTVIRNVLNRHSLLDHFSDESRNGIVTSILHESHSELIINKELLKIKESVNKSLVEIYDQSHLAESVEEIENIESFVITGLESNREYLDEISGKENEQNV